MNGRLMLKYRLNRYLLAGLMALSAVSCGGGAIIAAGISGTGAPLAGISGTGVVFGAITGFGSIFVNGVKYEVDDSTLFDVDGSGSSLATHKDDLKIGMVVRIESQALDGGGFQANSVVYDDNVEGPITTTVALVAGSTSKKSFQVMGVDVVVDARVTLFDDSSSSAGFDFDSITEGDLIEVSGLVDSGNVVQATRIEKKGQLPPSGITSGQVELHVSVPSPDPNGVITFSNGLKVNYDVNGITTDLTELPGNRPVAGQRVEIKGIFDRNSNTIEASKIEDEGGNGLDSVGEDSSFSIEGFISGLSGDKRSFTVGSPFGPVQVQLVDGAITQNLINQLIEGMRVEVEGSLQNDVLQASQLQIRDAQTEYRAQVQETPGAQSLIIGYPNVAANITLNINDASVILDERNKQIALTTLVSGNVVKVSARTFDGQHIVVSLKREANPDSKSFEISGELESANASSILIDGLLFPLDAAVSYGNGLPGVPNITAGTRIELSDTDRDGYIDEVELED